jgi:hypothetical protein
VLRKTKTKKTPPTIGVGEDVGKRNPRTLLVGMQATATILENNMLVLKN